MGLGRLAAVVLPWRHWKSAEQLREEIDAEVRFHLEELERTLRSEGLPRDRAWAEAEARFGDVQRLKLDCFAIQMGERIMLQRIQWGIIAVLAVALVVMMFVYANTVGAQRAMLDTLRAEAAANMERAQREAALALEYRADVEELERLSGVLQAPAREQVPSTPESVTAHWRARFLERPDDARHGLAVARALLEQLDPAEAVRVLGEIWSDLSDGHKSRVLEAVAGAPGHPGVLTVMHWGATDGALGVQNEAFSHLASYAFQSFSDDYDAYLAWHARWGDRPPGEVLEANAREFVARLHGRSPAELADVLRDFNRLDLRVGIGLGIDVAAVLREAGVLRVVESWLTSEDRDTLRRAFRWAASLEPGEAWMRQHMLPLVTASQTGVDARAAAAMRALGSPDNAWAVPAIVDYLGRVVPLTKDDTPHDGVWSGASALAGIGDPSVIPVLIGHIVANPCYDTVYGIGYFGLGKLTGVSWDESHDAEWWVEWWDKNLQRFPPHVQAIPIPGR